MYKITHGMSPELLTELLPQPNAHRNPYPIRNGNLIDNFKCRTESLKSSFFPQTIKDWNNLPDNIKNAPSLASFKRLLKTLPEYKAFSPPKWFEYGPRRLNIINCQLRNHCSPLLGDLFRNHVSPSPTCQSCTLNTIENSHHFFFVCPKYATPRRKLIQSLRDNNFAIEIEILLKGTIDRNYEDNIIIVKSVHDFITETKRFDNAE